MFPRNQLTLFSSWYEQPEERSTTMKTNLRSHEINHAGYILPLPLHIPTQWVVQRGWVHSIQEIQVWGLGLKCGELCGWNAFLSVPSPPSHAPLLHAPQLTPLWHIQWSAVPVIPTQRPRLSQTQGNSSLFVIEGQIDTVYKEILWLKKTDKEAEESAKGIFCKAFLRQKQITYLLCHMWSTWPNVSYLLFHYLKWETRCSYISTCSLTFLSEEWTWCGLLLWLNRIDVFVEVVTFKF